MLPQEYLNPVFKQFLVNCWSVESDGDSFDRLVVIWIDMTN